MDKTKKTDRHVSFLFLFLDMFSEKSRVFVFFVNYNVNYKNHNCSFCIFYFYILIHMFSGYNTNNTSKDRVTHIDTATDFQETT